MDDLDELLAQLESAAKNAYEDELNEPELDPYYDATGKSHGKMQPVDTTARAESNSQVQQSFVPDQPLKVQPVYMTRLKSQTSENDHLYSEVSEPSCVTDTTLPTATTAAQQLDEIMRQLLNLQAGINSPSSQEAATSQVSAPQSSTITSSAEQTAATQPPATVPPATLPPSTQLLATVSPTIKSPEAQIRDGDIISDMLESLEGDLQKRGLITVPKGCCALCQKPIVGKIITALGQTWHPEHFLCSHCGEELTNKSFFEKNGQAYCTNDYQELFSPRCAYCSGPVVDKVLTALDKTWHPEHFFCAHCGGVFNEEGFHEKNGKAYCPDDFYSLFSPKCGGCDLPVRQNYLSALNHVWHPECFVCRECLQPFEKSSFFEIDGIPFCELHYHSQQGTLCHACQKPVIGRCISAMGRRFHPEHFVCAFCLKQLSQGIFKEQNDKPYCQTCHIKLFF
ncbi:leupaxin-like isoform X2 [Protopterus annectens]|uniref:leupaxin-like isoform X2 n=1 Tax=Protopterus annectens TaxID=7888 RepID=UPI001CFABE31|nr:leupaxin-like isoform X2 [Protopterus annectens]